MYNSNDMSSSYHLIMSLGQVNLMAFEVSFYRFSIDSDEKFKICVGWMLIVSNDLAQWNFINKQTNIQFHSIPYNQLNDH